MKTLNVVKRKRGKSLGRRSNKRIRPNFDRIRSDSRDSQNPHKTQGQYETLARDASAAGDRVSAENFLQHAEHYLRLKNKNDLEKNHQKTTPQTLNDAE